MAFSTDDFNKVWASTSPLTPYEFGETNYKEGWNFIGSTPPARQMWDYLQKLTDEKIQYIYNNMIPTGIVQAFAGATTPQGWLLCDGSAISRTTYAALFAVIGTTYGTGDGSTTFNLPNLTDKFIQGNATAGTVKSAGLPNILGNVFITSANSYAAKIIQHPNAAGAFGGYRSDSTPMFNSTQSGGNPPEGTNNILTFSAANSNAIYGNSATVQPPALTMRYIIKY